MNFNTVYCENKFELAMVRPGKNETQLCTCHIVLNFMFKTLYAEPDTGELMWPLRKSDMLRWEIPCLTARAANRLLDKIKPHAQVIFNHYEKWLNGEIEIILFGDAWDAFWKIKRLCNISFAQNRNVIQSWDIEKFLCAPRGK